MDINMILALLVLSHVIADFVFQGDGIAVGKKTGFQRMFQHVGHHLLISGILLLPYLNSRLLGIIIVLALLHGAIDKGKTAYDERNGEQDKGFESFMADQALHLVLIGLSCSFIKDIQLNQFALSFGGFLSDCYPVFLNATNQDAFQFIVVLTGYIFNFKGATILIQKVLDKYLHLKMSGINEDTMNKDQRKKNAGEAIGNLERLLILTLVLQQHYAPIGLVVAGKALARHKRLEEKNFAEYFLVGTFTSISIALLTGILIAAIIN
ncbi:DUF3307 domain-containing protein [Acetonema longum]|uniref:DUF3307 domain-containing protein n=1 Tax=Acetonema longum TaxID=2374 RepID=UPI000318FABB|nr:DUF3307 domain-containing protein [Acetonema longum]